MGITNEFERDLVNQAQLKHPGRVDMIAFQNIPDAGDGSPGVQRCFRNYLHEGGMEKDLELIGFGIKGSSVDISNVELQQLSNIGSNIITSGIWTQIANIDTALISSVEWSQIANIGTSVITASIWTELSHMETVTITNAQWGYVGAFDQGLTITSNVAFGQITMSGNIIMGSDDITFTAGGLVDGVDVSAFKSDYDTHKTSTGEDHSYIDQSVVEATSPTFVGLTLSADLVTSSTIDSVDVSDFKDTYDAYIIAEHTREITPIYMLPDDGYTSGNDYVYYSSETNAFVTFGNNSYTAVHYLHVNFKLPSDYVDGENITIKLNVRTPSDVKTTYEFLCKRYRDGDSESGYGLGTLSGTWTESSSGPFRDQSLTITGTNLVGDDGVKLMIRLKGPDFASISQIQKIVLIIPVNTRD